MAESQLAETIRRDLLECGICLDRYKKPRGLPCLHCFCHSCLESYCKGQRNVLCPNCKRPTSVPKEGVSGFPAHFIINTLKDTLDKAKGAVQDAICGNCNLKKATSYCMDCKEFFFQTCRTAHDTLKANKDHKIISIDDLRSGKVMLPITPSEDQMCKDHEGETKKFYCVTCGKLICRDCCIVLGHRQHQVISLKEASQKQVEKLKDLSRGSEDLKKKCRNALKKTENVEKSLAIASRDVKKNLERVKNEYYKQVDAIFKKHEVDARSVEVKNAKELGHIKEKLQTTLAKLDSACDLATRVTQTGSNYDITSVFPTLSASLEELNEMTEPEAASELLGYVGFKAPAKVNIPDLFSVLAVKPGDKWVQSGKFSTKPGLEHPWGIAVNKDGDIAVANGNKKAQVFSNDGKVKCTFQGPFDASLSGIAITTDNKYILPGKGKILFYDSQGNRLNYPMVPTYNMSNKQQNPCSFAVDSTGRIIVGLEGTTISIHHRNGQFIFKFKAPSQPYWLAITSKGDIAVSSYDDCTLRLMDYSGNNVRVVQPPQEVTEWNPWAVCCSQQGEIFVVNYGNPKAVYRYTADGDQCLGSVITGLDDPTGIAISEDGQQLFVAEYGQCAMKLFQRQ
ncbi:uncharacterized protein [Amphiura filiformis]|uniref:uncharacterized protein n=1 Tax=Amphiura filiformis TaxID=82378 RepID=UPI003B21F075